ncbi:winged helix-turn-helix transcriptional regulator [Sphingobacterium daejeonense]|uniref:winged helix-turn-helix transcriptional regulator n=1 Tax=Sphingobacterium daejeonense TaxID=371142 RepID=UPI0010C3F814|nr:helix-turn-helix domain-containing protein [Sphingobacterium daejeonense]VTP91512.1 Uncharacterized HTH-type transcriptional regulator ytcD [Sphingobacterium daejeonense]
MNKKEKTHKDCELGLRSIQDALYVINGRWKILVLFSILHGNKRFNEIERSLLKINGKTLAKELRDLEQNGLITRTVYDARPVIIEYNVTDYANTLIPVFDVLMDWGTNHRKKIIGN